jgi:hypothetical protein
MRLQALQEKRGPLMTYLNRVFGVPTVAILSEGTPKYPRWYNPLPALPLPGDLHK